MGFDNFSHLNWLAVLVGAVGYFALGALWYTKILFGNSWIKHTGINPNDPTAKKGAGGIMGFSFVLMFIASIGIGLLLSRVGVSSWMSGLKTGLVAGVCFSATAVWISYLYEKKPFGLVAINCGYNIVGCMICGIIQAVWP